MRIVSWAVILGSSLALYLGGVRPVAEQWRVPISAIWSDLETDSSRVSGAMIDRANAGNIAAGECGDADADDAGTGQGEISGPESELCLESAVARQ